MVVDIGTLLPAAIMLAVVFAPVLLVVAGIVHQKRLEARDHKRSPLNDKLLHQAGANARRQAEDLGDDIMARVAVLMLIGPMTMMGILLPRVQWARIRFAWTDGLMLFLALGVVAWCVIGVFRLRRARRAWLNGMRGEMATAQELDRLRVRGCEVFHDIPGDRGNIDHVIVAPGGVFAVETKWRSKQGKGAASAEVWFDGKTLEFPGGYRDAAPLEQARACASELSKFLKARTGEPVSVVPVVALPGWYAKNRSEGAMSDAMLINPKMAYKLLERAGDSIPQAQRNRIIAAISDRYPQLQD